MRAIAQRILCVVLLVAMGGSLGHAQSPDQNPPARSDHGVKQDMKAAGHSTKQAAKKTGHKVKRSAKKATHKAAHKTSQGAQKVEDKTQTPPPPPPQE